MGGTRGYEAPEMRLRRPQREVQAQDEADIFIQVKCGNVWTDAILTEPLDKRGYCWVLFEDGKDAFVHRQMTRTREPYTNKVDMWSLGRVLEKLFPHNEYNIEDLRKKLLHKNPNRRISADQLH